MELSGLSQSLLRGFECQPKKGYLVITTPFTYPNGKPIILALKNGVLTDLKETYNYITSCGVSLQSKSNGLFPSGEFNGVLQNLKVNFHKCELCIPYNDFSDIFKLAQACVVLSHHAYFSSRKL